MSDQQGERPDDAFVRLVEPRRGLNVLALRGTEVAGMTAFLDPSIHRLFPAIAPEWHAP